MRTNKLLWGLFFIAAAVLVVLNQLGYSNGISLWGLLVTILLLPVVFYGILHRNFFNFFFGIAFLLIVYQHPLGIERLVPWTVLAAALFLSIGFSIIIKPKGTPFWHGDWHGHWGSRTNTSEYTEYTEHVDVDGNEVNCRVSMSGSIKYLHSDSLQKGSFECSLGSLKVYFDNVVLHPDGADIYVNCSLGSVELFIPRNWPVMINVDSALGGVDEKPRRDIPSGPPLRIHGSVKLGALEIKYY
ncbi:MAG: LiaF transmembrane domain-containing protein [Lachnospiraceae bacterium]